MKTHKVLQSGFRLVALALASTVCGLAEVTGALATLIVNPPVPVVTTEGASANIGLGSFADTDSSSLGWHVVVNWGDATPLTSFIIFTQGPLGSPSHTYAEESLYTISVQVTNSVTGSVGISTFAATTADAPLNGASTPGISGIAGSPFNGNVGNFTDLDPGGMVSDYAASINWGDATPLSIGTIVSGVGMFNVSGTHTYATFGTFFTSTTITDVGGSRTTVVDLARIAPAPEPATLALLGVGLAGLGFARRHKLN